MVVLAQIESPFVMVIIICSLKSNSAVGSFLFNSICGPFNFSVIV